MRCSYKPWLERLWVKRDSAQVYGREGAVFLCLCAVPKQNPPNPGFTRSEPFLFSCFSCTYRPHFSFRHKFLPPKENTFHSHAIFTHEMWVTKHLLVENNIYVVGQLSSHHLKLLCSYFTCLSVSVIMPNLEVGRLRRELHIFHTWIILISFHSLSLRVCK